MYDVLRFWLERGVDGFRVDVIWLLIKDAELRDNPPNPDYRPTEPASARFLSRHNADQPETHEIVSEMRSVLEEYDDRVLIGEIYLPIERAVTYYGKDLRGAHLPFNFQLIQTAWTAAAIAQLVTEYESALPPGGWPNWVLGNHDRPENRGPRRRRASADRRHAAADVAWHADHVLRRRTWDRSRRYTTRIRAGSVGKKRARFGIGPGFIAHTVSMECDEKRRLHGRAAMASAQLILQVRKRCNFAQRSDVVAQSLSPSAIGSPPIHGLEHRHISADRSARKRNHLRADSRKRTNYYLPQLWSY